MSMQLHDYQSKGVLEVATELTKHRRVLCQLATGGGKTVMFCAIASRYVARSGKAVLILVHREELMNQTRATLFNGFGINGTLITSASRTVPVSPVYIGMVQSTIGRLDRLYNIGLVIIDECHRAEFFKIHPYFPNELVIGFTATPLSASKKKPLKNYFEEIVCCVDIPELIRRGFLCQNITYAPKDVVDRAALRTKGNDFDEHQMSDAYRTPRYVNNTVTAYEKWTPGTKAIVYNVNIEHSRAVTAAFAAKSHPVQHLDGGHSSYERRNILNWFRTTPGAVLCSCEILTAGFDESTIETVIMNRATQSMPLWIQCTGRGSRPNPSKHLFTIIDLGANAITHGDWCDERNWRDLFHNPPKPGEGGVAPVKNCVSCDAIIPASTMTCPFCQATQPQPDRPEETPLEKFVIVTKNIDVVSLMHEHRHRKEYYPFFEIGTTLAKEAKRNFPRLDDATVANIEQEYYRLAKEWATQLTASRKKLKERFDADLFSKLITPEAYEKAKPTFRAVTWNSWHREKAKEHLYNELAKRFKTWINPLSASTPASV